MLFAFDLLFSRLDLILLTFLRIVMLFISSGGTIIEVALPEAGTAQDGGDGG
jgi:hypothetical protein